MIRFIFSSKVKRLLWSFPLLLWSAVTLAADGWNVSGNVDPVSSHTDLSIAYLAQVFGTVGSSLQGTSGQMLGMLFSKLDQGIMVVAGLWLIYTVMTIVLRSAMDGSFMGPNRNVFWIVIRIALAFAMLIPGPMTGYNLIQDIVMKVVVEGVSLADQTWNFGLDYVSSGGTLWRSPNTTSGGSHGIVSDSQAKSILKTTQSIFNAEVCMVASSIQNDNNINTGGNTGMVNIGNSPVVYHIVENDKQKSFAFPGLGNTQNYLSHISNGHEQPACGSVKWTDIQGAGDKGTHAFLAKAALSQVVYDLLPAAKKYACSNYSGAGASTVCSSVVTASSSVYPENQDVVFRTLVNYVNAVFPLAQAEQKGGTDIAMNWISNAKEKGWLVAGRYYWDLSQIQAYEGKVSDLGSYAPPESSGYSRATAQSETLKKFMSSSDLDTVWHAYVNGNSSYPQGALKKLKNYSTASTAGAAVSAQAEGTRDAINKALGSLSFLLAPLGDMVSLILLFSSHTGGAGMSPDPIFFLHQLGMRCISLAGSIWFGIAITLSILSLATMICQGTLNLDTPLRTVTNWLKPPLMLIAGVFFSVGVLLGYYVPIYPFMLFIFGVIGWIISVIEAMVAGPLIAFGLTHPEGHDFLGEARQGLILLLGVFLRPVLMVIGLIAGMILSYVSLRILVYTYSGFLSDIFYQVHPTVGSPSDVLLGATEATGNMLLSSSTPAGLIAHIFTFPLMLAIFAALIYVVTNQCFSLIYILPDYILRWIGGPAQASAATDMARQVQGATSGMSQTTGDATSRAIQGRSDAQSAKKDTQTTSQLNNNDQNSPNNSSSNNR